MQFDREKFKNLIHYVIWKVDGKDDFGATKLYKALWFSEGRSYALRQAPIAGAEYVRQKYGPIPKLGMQIRNELEEEGKISQKKIDRGDYEEWFFKALQPPPVNFLTPDEKVDVDWWTTHIAEQHTASSISEASHDYAWSIARIGEPLPLFAYRVSRIDEPTDEDVERLKNRAKEIGLM